MGRVWAAHLHTPAPTPASPSPPLPPPTPQSGSVGLDLSFAAAVFLMEPLEDFALEQQVGGGGADTSPH